MLAKAEEIAAYKEEIAVFRDRMKNAFMPSRLKGEYDMMIDRIKVLLKELGEDLDLDAPPTQERNNETTDTNISTIDSNHSSLPCISDKLPSDTEQSSESTEEINFPGILPFQDSPERIDTTKTTGVYEGPTITSR